MTLNGPITEHRKPIMEHRKPKPVALDEDLSETVVAVYIHRFISLFCFLFKGSDRQSEVVELSMQYCAQIL